MDPKKRVHVDKILFTKTNFPEYIDLIERFIRQNKDIFNLPKDRLILLNLKIEKDFFEWLNQQKMIKTREIRSNFIKIAKSIMYYEKILEKQQKIYEKNLINYIFLKEKIGFEILDGEIIPYSKPLTKKLFLSDIEDTRRKICEMEMDIIDFMSS